MLAKMTSKNQLTLPKNVTSAVGPTEYLDVQAKDGQIILTPVRIQGADAVRAKLAELELREEYHGRCRAGQEIGPQSQKMSRASRVVLDASVALSAVVFTLGRLGTLREI